MFHKQPELHDGQPLVLATEIEQYQRAKDPKTEAAEFIERTRQDLLLAEVHPWYAPNVMQIQSVMAHIAWYTDRTAEIMCEEGTVQTKDGDRVVADVASFALALSQVAINQLDQGGKVKPDYGEADVTFTDDWRNVLAPEAQLPYWPTFMVDGTYPEWQGGEVSGLSTAFLRGVVRAARWINTVVDKDLRDLTSASATVAIPDQYAEDDVISYIRGRLKEAEIDLATAEGLVGEVEDIPDNVKHVAYVKAHDAYVNMIQASLWSVSPQLLGDDFTPQRNDAK